MQTSELLLNRRWILKFRERELYYQVKDELASIKKFLNEKMGYQVIVNPYLVKVEKIPAKPENWMGISDFKDPIEYSFLCLILMFLEDKEAEEQFVLSELTEFIQVQYKEEQVDWTKYHYRRHLITVMKYCVNVGMLNVNDGNEDSFSRDDSSEVLYENTGVSRYFMKNFTQDIMAYQKPEDFVGQEWIDVDETRGIVRRQRVYRSLVMTPGIERSEETEEDFAYIKNYRNMIQGELEQLLDCELQVYRNSAFLILGEESRLGHCFPEENTISDIILLVNQLLLEQIKQNKIVLPANERICIPREQFRDILEECKKCYGTGFSKQYREMTTGEFCTAVEEYLRQLEWITLQKDDIVFKTVVGKVIGCYEQN